MRIRHRLASAVLAVAMVGTGVVAAPFVAAEPASASSCISRSTTDFYGRNQNAAHGVVTYSVCITDTYVRLTFRSELRCAICFGGGWHWLTMSVEVDGAGPATCTWNDFNTGSRSCQWTRSNSRGSHTVNWWYTGDYKDDGGGAFSWPVRSVHIAN